jgi:hypothetical protein
MLNFGYFYSVNALPIDDRLSEQINNIVSELKRFDAGTKCKLSPDCGLAMGNLQVPGIVSLSN